MTSKTGDGIEAGAVMPLGRHTRKDKIPFVLLAIVGWRLNSELGLVAIRIRLSCSISKIIPADIKDMGVQMRN